MYPFLLHVYFYVNPIKALIEATSIEDNDFFFGQIISSDDVIKFTLKNELQLFRQLCVWQSKIENPLAWWGQHTI
jgi:hypothetical protein